MEPPEFVAVTVKLVDASVTDGVPEICPVCVLNSIPAGSDGVIPKETIEPPEAVGITGAKEDPLIPTKVLG